MNTIALQGLISAISQSAAPTGGAAAVDTPVSQKPAAATALPPELLQNPPAALKFFITQAGNLNQPARIYLFLLGTDMKIADLIANPKLAIEQTRNQMLSQLRPGQTVQATVVEPPQQGVAHLRIGTAEMMIRTQLPLLAGEQLLLDVIKAKSGDGADLRLIQQPTIKHFQARALRNLLPQQIPLTKLVESLRQLTTDNSRAPVQGGTETRLPPTLATPLPRASLPHQQLIQTLRSVAPETLTTQARGREPVADEKSVRTVMDRPLPGRNTRFNHTGQLLQRLAGSTASNAPPPTARGAPPPPSPTQLASITTTVARGSFSLPSYPAPSLPVISKLITALPPESIGKPTTIPVAATSTTNSSSPKALLSSAVIKQIENVLNHTAGESDRITAAKVRELFGTSGLFLESTLASGKVPTADLKASLLHLLFNLRPGAGGRQGLLQGNAQQAASIAQQGASLRLLAELQSLAEGALARIQVNQLSSLPQDEGSRQVWQFELPLAMPKNSDNFLIRIEHDASNNEKNGAAGWSVILNFDIEPIGPMSAKLSLKEDEISSHFTARLSDSARLVEAALPTLAGAYIRAGLKVGKLSCRQGQPEEIESQPPRIDLPLLDEKA